MSLAVFKIRGKGTALFFYSYTPIFTDGKPKQFLVSTFHTKQKVKVCEYRIYLINKKDSFLLRFLLFISSSLLLLQLRLRVGAGTLSKVASTSACHRESLFVGKIGICKCCDVCAWISVRILQPQRQKVDETMFFSKVCVMCGIPFLFIRCWN